MYVFGRVQNSVVDGPGIRYSLFVQGCPHNCEGCHNPDSHEFRVGKICTVKDIYTEIKQNPLTQGVTFSGGEPFCQAIELYDLGLRIKSMGLNLIIYTGYTWEYLTSLQKTDERYKLLCLADYIVDSKFNKDLRDLSLLFRGSSNQRVIAVQKSLINKKLICDYTFGRK